jgi:hypothetical protein
MKTETGKGKGKEKEKDSRRWKRRANDKVGRWRESSNQNEGSSK